ncbi:MAG: hypothetical protein J6B12_02135 [Clostridia bacterium]|nr:hypothetical protein [Clostridia bacterium]
MKKLQLNAEKRDILFRSLLALAVLFVTVLLQTSFLPQVDLFGAIPDLVLILVVGIGFFNGAKVGIPFGIGAGVVCYLLGGSGAAMIILLYALLGFLSSRLVSGRNYISWCIYMAAACVIKMIWSLLMCLVLSAVPRPMAALWHSLLPELVGTLVLSLALYYPVKAAAKLVKRKSEL